MRLGTHFQTLAAVAVIGVMSAQSTFALSTIDVTTGTKSLDLSCTGSCEVWDLTSPGFSSTVGDWLSISAYTGVSNNSNTNRLALINGILGAGTFAMQSESSDDIPGVPNISGGYTGGDPGSWTSSAAYFVAWGGSDPRHVLIKNNSANNVFTWDGGSGAGLSGVDGFGVVPLPAAGWLLLAAFGGLGAANHLRKRRAV